MCWSICCLNLIFICVNLNLWSSFFDFHFMIFILWSSFMIFILSFSFYDLHLWSSFLIFILWFSFYDLHLWFSFFDFHFLIFICDLNLWSSFMNLVWSNQIDDFWPGFLNRELAWLFRPINLCVHLITIIEQRDFGGNHRRVVRIIQRTFGFRLRKHLIRT